MTLFSIVTVTKNNPAGFSRTHNSLSLQDCSDYEWLVQDGAVTPDTGIYDAMNQALDRAIGQYVIFMNAGDVFATSQTLSIVAAHAGSDFIYGDAIEDGRLKPARHDIARGMITHHQAMAYRRDVIGPLRYDTNYHIAADYKFTAQFLRHAQTRQHVALPVCVFAGGGVSQIKTALGRREQAAIRQELGIKAPGVQVAQVAAQTLKTVAPGLYWKLRSRLKTSRT